MEENKNLEIPKKKPGKSWLFWAGLILIILVAGVVLIPWDMIFFDTQFGYLPFVVLYIFSPLVGVLGGFLILIHYLKSLFRVGIGLTVLVLGFIGLNLLTSSSCGEFCLLRLMLIIISLPFGLLGLVLILMHYFQKRRKKSI